MLGLGDIWVFMTFVLCIAAALLCVGYGIKNWNKGDEMDESDANKWRKEEIEIEKNL